MRHLLVELIFAIVPVAWHIYRLTDQPRHWHVIVAVAVLSAAGIIIEGCVGHLLGR